MYTIQYNFSDLFLIDILFLRYVFQSKRLYENWMFSVPLRQKLLQDFLFFFHTNRNKINLPLYIQLPTINL